MFGGAPPLVEAMIRNDFAYEPLDVLFRQQADMAKEVCQLEQRAKQLAAEIRQLEERANEAKRSSERAARDLAAIREAARRLSLS